MKGMKAWGIREEDEMYGKLTDQNVVNFKRTMQKKKKGTRACLEDETLWQEVGNRNEKKGEELLEEQRGYGRDEICLVKWNLGWYDMMVCPYRHIGARTLQPRTARCAPVWRMWSYVVLLSRQADVKQGGGWTENPAVFEHEGQTTTHLNHMDVFQQLNRAFVRCMHATGGL